MILLCHLDHFLQDGTEEWCSHCLGRHLTPRFLWLSMFGSSRASKIRSRPACGRLKICVVCYFWEYIYRHTNHSWCLSHDWYHGSCSWSLYYRCNIWVQFINLIAESCHVKIPVLVVPLHTIVCPPHDMSGVTLGQVGMSTRFSTWNGQRRVYFTRYPSKLCKVSIVWY